MAGVLKMDLKIPELNLLLLTILAINHFAVSGRLISESGGR